MTYRFFLTRNKPDGTSRIDIRFHLKGKRFWVKTDRYTYVNLWNQSSQKSKDGPTQAFLDMVRNVVAELEKRCYLIGTSLTKEVIKGKFLEVLHKPSIGIVLPETDYSLFESFDIYFHKYTGQKEYNYLRKFLSAKKHIYEFDSSLKWSDIDKSFLDKYVDHCVNSKKPLQNPSINKYLSCLRECCRMAIDDGILVPRAYESFKVKQQKVKPIWLTREEAAALFAVEVKTTTEQIVLDDSACRYYLALRHSDIDQLQKHHFQEINGQLYIGIYLIKTKSDLSLPVPKQAAVILERYDYSLPTISMQEKNRLVKVLAKRAGLNRMVEKVRFSGSRRITKVLPLCDVISTHTFRRSFGRRFMESVGDINKLSDIYGHSDTKTTEGYIGWESKEIAEAMNRMVF